MQMGSMVKKPTTESMITVKVKLTPTFSLTRKVQTAVAITEPAPEVILPVDISLVLSWRLSVMVVTML